MNGLIVVIGGTLILMILCAYSLIEFFETAMDEINEPTEDEGHED
jgi:hypothetical protein